MRYLCGKRARKICLGIRWKSKKYLIDIHSMSFREARCWYLFFGDLMELVSLVDILLYCL